MRVVPPNYEVLGTGKWCEVHCYLVSVGKSCLEGLRPQQQAGGVPLGAAAPAEPLQGRFFCPHPFIVVQVQVVLENLQYFVKLTGELVMKRTYSRLKKNLSR